MKSELSTFPGFRCLLHIGAPELLRRLRPSVYTFREHIEAGGLIAYSRIITTCFSARRTMWTRKGAKPGELQIGQPTKFAALLTAGFGSKRTFYACRRMSVLGGKAVMQRT
jgi:hypothetical protein